MRKKLARKEKKSTMPETEEPRQSLAIGFSFPCVCGKAMIEGAAFIKREFARKELEPLRLACKVCQKVYTLQAIVDLTLEVKIITPE
jgi:hypothetical protein